MRQFIIAAVLAALPGAATFAGGPLPAMVLSAEHGLSDYGGIPFIRDLDGGGAPEILWLQAPGIFQSKLFDKPPWNGRITDRERELFCLTATRPDGEMLWQVGQPWAGDRPFVTHCAERALDAADIDGDGAVEVVCARRGEVLVIDGKTGAIEASAAVPSDNGQIIRLGHTGTGAADWTILVKNTEASYEPHEYANPVWFFNSSLELIKTADYHGAGHSPLVADLDGDGLDEFVIGYNLVESDLTTRWSFDPVPADRWNAAEMHVDDVFAGDVGGRPCIALAASDTAYLLDARDGSLIWKHPGTHPQHCQLGHFLPGAEGYQVFVHNKRAELQLFDAGGAEEWNIMPPRNFPLGEAEAVRGQKFHVFDPTEVLRGLGPAATDLLIFTDLGWPYVLDGQGQRVLEFPAPPNAAQDWGSAPGRPDDYGYGYYARVADFDGDSVDEALINDRRFAWLYEIEGAGPRIPRSAADVLHADFEHYTDGIVQALNAGVRWLGDPFSNRNEGTVEITRDFGFAGARCAHVASDQADEIARVRLQPRYDAPALEGDEVIEFLFRPVQEGSANLKDFAIWRAGDHAGLELLADGDADTGTYRVDVVHASASTAQRTSRAQSNASHLPQDGWTHFVMHRKRGEYAVDLWIGAPGAEAYVGNYPDPGADAVTRNVEIGDTSLETEYGSGYWDDIRIGAPLRDGQAVAPPEPRLRDVSQEAPDIAYPIEVGAQKQLFADDAIVETTEGLTRTLHPVKKHPANPLIVPDKPWEGLSVLLYGSVLRDPETGKFRMWYLAWGKHAGKPTSICYAESEDGLAWMKPNLGIQEFEGSTDNNILMPGWSQTTILYDPRDPDPSQRYKGVLRMNGTRGFLSPDGLHWRDAGILMDQAYDGTTVQWNPITEKWIAMVKIFRDGKRARGYAESDDFFHWTDTYYLGTVDERDDPGDQMYSIYPFFYEGLLFGHLRMYHTSTDKIDTQLITSRNGKQWNRDIRTTFIPCSPEKGSWDFGNNSVPTSAPVRVGDELWFYYAGRSTLHDEVPNTGAIGLGTLRADGFFSMDAGAEGGVLTTKPLRLEGDTLYVNADATGGSIRVEVIDESGAVFGPYSANQCVDISGDNVRIPVSWEGGNGLANLHGKTARLRFHLKNARLYSFWTAGTDTPQDVR